MLKKVLGFIFSMLVLVALFFCTFFSVPTFAEELGEVQASSVILVVGDTDNIAYEKNADEKMAPASLTKILTALLIEEAVESGQYDYDTEVTVTASALENIQWDASRMDNPVVAGEVMTVESYLKAILVRSDALCCNVMAEFTSGSKDAFVERMNERLAELGCTNSHFVDTYGYAGMKENHYSTARDIYKISREAMKHEKFAEIVAQQSVIIPETNKSYERKLYSTNWLIDMTAVYNRYGHTAYTNTTYDKCIGIKTGMTDEAGNCLAAAARDNDLTVYSIVMGAKDIVNPDTSNTRLSFSETKRMFEWAYGNYDPVTAFKKHIILGSMSLEVGEDEVTINVGAEDTLVAGVPKGTPENKVTYKLEQTVKEGNLEVGDEIGTVTAYYGDICLGSSKLVALDSVASAYNDDSKVTRKKKDNTKVILIVVAIIIVAGVIAGKAYLNHLRKKKIARRRARRRRMMEEKYGKRSEIDFEMYKKRSKRRR